MSAGWYPDPSGRFEFRYHNGTSWTGDVSTAGQRFVDQGLATPPGRTPGRHRLATASLVCGVIGLTICWLPVLFAAGFVLGLLGLVFGIVVARRARRGGTETDGFATAGMLTGGVAIAGSVGGLVLTAVTFGAIDRYENPAPNTVTIDRCESDEGRLTVGGTLRNDDAAGQGTSDFTVLFEARRPGGTAVLRARRQLDDVAPGETATFEVTARTRVDEIECEVLEVTGPLPFGLAP